MPSMPGVLQGLNEPPGASQADVPGLQLALAVIVSLYVLRDKKRLDLGNQLLIIVSTVEKHDQLPASLVDLFF